MTFNSASMLTGLIVICIIVWIAVWCVESDDD